MSSSLRHSSDTEDPATNPGEKRRRARSDRNAKKKKTKKPSLKKLGRVICKAVSLFEDLGTLVLNSDAHEELLENPELAATDSELISRSTEEIKDVKRRQVTIRERAYISVKLLNELVPNFLKKVDESEPDDLQQFYDTLQTGGRDARSDDTTRIKMQVAAWLNARTPTPSPLLDPDLDWDDATTRTQIQNGDPDVNIGSTCYLRALYAFEKGDPSKVWEGFLMSGLLVLVYKHLFTSPSSAKGVVHETADLVNFSRVLRHP
ncbi:hypothetical protein H0H81_000542, partial [Sphagnurus paluster]